MDDAEKTQLLAKAKRLESRMLYVKAAEIYLPLAMEAEAASAYERGGAYDKASALFEKMGKKEDAARCRRLRDENSTGATWQDTQAEFQKDAGNPY